MRAKYACKVSAAPRKLFGLVRSGPVRFLVQFGSVRCICIGIGGSGPSAHPNPTTQTPNPANHPLWRPAGENCICVSVDELGELPGGRTGGLGWLSERVLGAHRGSPHGSAGKVNVTDVAVRCGRRRQRILPCCNVCQRQNFLQKQKLELILF